MTKKKKGVLILIAVMVVIFAIVLGYMLGQIPMLGNQAEQYENFSDKLEYHAIRSIELAQATGTGISNGVRGMCSAASLSYGDAIYLLGTSSIEMSFSEEDRQLLYDFAKYYKIIVDDLAMMEDDKEYYNSEAHSLHGKIFQLCMIEGRKDRSDLPISPNQDWTFEKGLLDMFKMDVGKEMFAEMEQYMETHRNYDPYGEYELLR